MTTEPAAPDLSQKPEVRIFRGPRGLAELADLWRGLADELKDASPTHAYEWHRSFIDAQEPEPEAMIFAAVFVDESLQAILPLRPIRKRLAVFGRHGLEVPTNPHVPFTDIVVKEPERLRAVLPRVLEELASEHGIPWDYLLIRRTLPDSCAVRCLPDMRGIQGWMRQAGTFHYHPVRSFDALVEALPGQYRKNVRRAHKRAEELGNVSYHWATSREECERLFPEFLHVEASGWKGENGTGTAIALDPGLLRFYTTLMEGMADRDRCRIAVIRHESRPIAASFGLVMDGTIYGLKIGFDEDYARIAPGTLLHWYILRNACEDPRLETYNMVSDSAWQSQWRPLSGVVTDIAVFRPGLGGRIASIEQRALARGRAWRQDAIRRWIVTEHGRRRLTWRPLRRE